MKINYSFFFIVKINRFPNNEELRKIWIKNMEIDRELSKSSRLCSIHFSQKCFKPAFYTGTPRLIEGAIPTIKSLEEFIELETEDETIDNKESNETITIENIESNIENTHSLTKEFNNKNQDEQEENKEEFDFENIEEFSPDEYRFCKNNFFFFLILVVK